MHMGVRKDRSTNDELVIDSVVTSEQGLGPTIPDGGYGWIVFLATLFFQAVIPSILAVYGIFMAFLCLENDMPLENINKLWDEKLFYAPLFFCAAWTVFDPTSRHLITHSTWPRLVGSAGTSLTCAGLLFLWMGMATYHNAAFFALAGIISGCGASIQIAQCEVLLAQYFRLKHTVLLHVTQAIVAFGFMISPIAIGYSIMSYSLLKVILWYQAVLLQGLVVSIAFKKPLYLKSKQRTYQYITDHIDDEEDVLSKNSKELQIKRQDGNTIERILIHEPSTSQGVAIHNTKSETSESTANIEAVKQKWESFDDDEEDIYVRDEKSNQTDPNQSNIKNDKKNWEKFEDEPERIPKNLTTAFNSSGKERYNNLEISTVEPRPLYNNLEINLNNTYSFEEGENHAEQREPVVFSPTTKMPESKFCDELKLLKQLTFYKSLLMVVTMKFSKLVFYTLFPTYLYIKIDSFTIKRMSVLFGLLSAVTLLFAFVNYWINVNKERRAIWLWVLCWSGSAGYFMLSDANTTFVFLLGAMQVVMSISNLEHVGSPLLGLTIRGETSKEYCLLSIISGLCFLFFLVINFTFVDVFRFMAMLHFVTGSVWFSNFVYKKISKLQ